jgi:pimeloyl-ACP methyl ester carboxylesterase
LDLPSCAKAASGSDVEADTVAVEAALDQLPGDEPAVLCGHSRGGLMVTEAGTHPRVGELVYITAMLVAPGQNLAEAIGPTTLFNHVVRFDDGTSIPQGDAVAPLLYNDCPPDDAAWAASRLRPMHPGGAHYVGGTGTESSREAWRHRPSTYVVCTNDRVISADAQRGMARLAGRSVEWETGHSPFLSRPEVVARLLIGLS